MKLKCDIREGTLPSKEHLKSPKHDYGHKARAVTHLPYSDTNARANSNSTPMDRAGSLPSVFKYQVLKEEGGVEVPR